MSTFVRLGLVLLFGCGRIGFDPAGQSDAGQPIDARQLADATIPTDASEILQTAFAHWRFDEGMGTVALDSTGNDHTLLLVNATWTAGVNGSAASVDGTGGYLIAPALSLFHTQAITIAAWVRRTYSVGPAHTLFELSQDFNSFETGLGWFPDDISSCVTGLVSLGVKGNAGYNIRCYAQPSSDVWHHLVGIFDKAQPGDSEITLYVDGILQNPVTTPYSANNNNSFGTQPFYVFTRGGSAEFSPGQVDELVIFDRALTPAEVAQL